MKVDIWSDVRCPFCYIGKRNFEVALERFTHKNEVEITWHSFELDPTLETQPYLNTIDYFVQAKGVSKEQAEQMLDVAKQMAREAKLDMDLKNSKVANSFKAHQLIQLAKKKGLGNEVEEALFKVHFTDLENIDDENVLAKTGASIGIEEQITREALSSQKYADDVRKDQLQARDLGVKGVPFFVINSKYGVSGAQPAETFLDILQKAHAE
ncbi:DSBA oxidoreductase [Salinimicrobium marinum]|uniref:DSBA oxidoreductase n=1 Tax=Salinimicrobium marinum TaxID=680283 RepID=A0A918SDG1_9FLAO|nr:DsbA family oxidoreductase [Salinimicrobium marinum]GHA35472.1 DSBA oxidoreductase [Salinimicrobium marinum]